MVELRDYQVQAVDACARELKHEKTALVVLATGAGKSFVAAEIARRFIKRNPTARVLILCFVQEILESNDEACKAFHLDSGIYCAGLGKRESSRQVVHASRDSLGVKPTACGDFDMIIIDEAHLISEDKKSRYRKIIDTIEHTYLLGLTATPFRLDGGKIYGRRKLFPRICYEIGTDDLVKRGFLVPYVYPKLPQLIDTSEIKIVKGEFDPKAVERVVTDTQIIKASLETWALHAKDRRCTLFFCHSLEHARRCIAAFTNLYGLPCAYLDGETRKDVRAAIVADMRAGKLRALFQVGTMTTGTNIPIIDCVMWLRPTASPVLFVQGSGRGSRLSPSKRDCLIIDVVGNLDRFKCLSNPVINPTGKSQAEEFTPAQLIAMGIDPDLMKGKAPTKECKCGTVVHAAAKKCDGCGELFLTYIDPREEHLLTPALTEVLKVRYQYTETRNGEPVLIIFYWTKKGEYTEWILYQKSWENSRYCDRVELIKTGQIKYLQVKPNYKKPKFPKLTPLSAQMFNDLQSAG